MKIKIVCVGKLKESFYRAASAEYAKRLGAYATLSIEEVSDEKTPDKAPLSLCEQIKMREGERILSRIKPQEWVILLDIGGKMYSSEQLSAKLCQYMNEGKGQWTFVIGGSLGVSEAVRQRANERWSFSKLTFPHQLMRVVLLEQIYRGFKILRHEPYHK